MQPRILADVGRDDLLAAEIDVFQVVGHAEEVVEVEQRRGPVVAGPRFDDAHRLAGGGEVDAVAARADGALRVAAVVDDFLRGDGEHVLDQRPGEAQPPVRIEMRALGGRDLANLVGDRAQADVGEHGEGGGADPLEVLFAEGPVGAARKPRPHCLRAPRREPRSQAAASRPARDR